MWRRCLSSVAVLLGALLFAGCMSEGIRETDVSRFALEPPDADIAVGPGGTIQTVNFLARISQGGNVYNRFVQDITGCPGFDPHVAYDAAADRFVMVSIVPFASPGAWCVAVSASGNPLGNWYRLRVSPHKEFTTGSPTAKVDTWPDFPGIGISGDKIVLTGNLFGPSGGEACVQFSGILVIDKGALYAGAGNVATTYVDPPACGTCPCDPNVYLQPAIHLSPSPNNDAYLSGHNIHGTPAKKLWLFRISGPAGAVTVSRANIPLPAGRYIRRPANAIQAGSSVRIQTNDARQLPKGVVARGNELFTVFHQGCTPAGDWARRSCIRMFHAVFNPDGSVWLAEDNRIATVGTYYYYPAAVVTADGDQLFAMNRSSSATPVQIVVSGRRYGDPQDTVREIRNFVNSPSIWTGFFNRWGDSNGASLAANGYDSYFTAEYAAGPFVWGTKTLSVGHNQLPPH